MAMIHARTGSKMGWLKSWSRNKQTDRQTRSIAVPCPLTWSVNIRNNKKLSYRRWTARRAKSVKMLSTVETSCTTNPQQIEVMEFRVAVGRLVVNSHDSSIVV